MACPVCGNTANTEEKQYGRYLKISCPKCGNFNWEKDIPRYIQNYKNHSTLLSYWIRNNQNSDNRLHLNNQLVEAIIRDVKLPSLVEKANRLLILIGNDLTRPDIQVILNQPKILKYTSKIGAIDEGEICYLIDFLNSKNWINTNIKYDSGAKNKIIKGYVALTFSGWSEFDKLNKGDNSERVVFMAMDFNDPKVDEAYQKCFKSAVKQTGFTLFNLKEKPRAGLIDNRLRAEIRRSRFILADLTNDNLGAYWEAGFAEGLGKPVIYLCEKEHFEIFKTHFDTNHHYTVLYKIDELNEAAENLKATIRATLPAEVITKDK